MEFINLRFALFVGLAFVLHQVLRGRWRQHLLLALSWAFYAWWGLANTLLMAGLVALAYLAGRTLAGEAGEKRPVAVAAGAVLLLFAPLAAFKCSRLLSPAWGADRAASAALVAPLGISYYTFRLASYVLDVLWRRAKAERSLGSFALFASFFPHVVAGPIQRAPDFLSQLPNQAAAPEMVTTGLRHVLFGVFKKVVVADRLAPLVDHVFAAPAGHVPLEAALGALAFAVQLYADFSGLSDVAIGLALMFGIRSPRNFDSPFYSRNVQEFWRRWHISLTSWLSDYLFTPLQWALRRLGRGAIIAAIFANMVAIGLWHGVRATFLAFGVVNAIYLSISVLRPRRTRGVPGACFLPIVAAFVLLRAERLSDAASLLRSAAVGLGAALVSPHRVAASSVWHLAGAGFPPTELAVTAAAIAAMETVHLAARSASVARRFEDAPVLARWAGYYALILAAVFLGAWGRQRFIYSQF